MPLPPETEKAVEIESRQFSALPRLGNCDRWADAVVIGLTKRHDDVQPVGRAALEEHDELLAIGHGRLSDGPLEKGR